MANGTISEDGTYDELIARQGPFSEFAKSFGSGDDDSVSEASEDDVEKDLADANLKENPIAAEEQEVIKEEQGEEMPKLDGGALMQQEERSIGSVPGKGESILGRNVFSLEITWIDA